jgi:hypothetical protein
MKTFFLLVALVVCLGCSSLPQKAMLLNPGDSKADVIRTMGTPDDHQFRGEDEVFQYGYVAAFGTCEYRVLWFSKGRLVGSTSYRANCAGGAKSGMRAVHWEDKPDQTIEIRRR